MAGLLGRVNKKTIVVLMSQLMVYFEFSGAYELGWMLSLVSYH